MKKLIKSISLCLLLLVGFTSCSVTAHEGSDAFISKLINKEGTFLVDVRTPEEYAAEPIVGAVNIPLNEIPQRIEDFKGKKKIVVYCRSGRRASKAKAILEKNGIKNVFNGTSYQRISKLKK